MDAVTVNINVNFTTLGSGILGQSSQTQSALNYSTVRAALVADVKSAHDITAAGSLPASSIPLYINGTSDNPNGSGSLVPYLDNNNSVNNTTVRITTANQKALGLLAANALALTPASPSTAVSPSISTPPMALRRTSTISLGSPPMKSDMPWGL